MSLQFDTSTSLGDIVAADYRAAGVFDRLGLDFCCGGKRTFGEACAAARLDPGAVAAELAKLSATSGADDVPDVSWPVEELAHYIVSRHHGYVRQQLPVISRPSGEARRGPWRAPSGAAADRRKQHPVPARGHAGGGGERAGVVTRRTERSALLQARQGEGPMRHTRIIVSHYGGPDELRVIEEECPEPKDGEVRVRVLAAGVSLPDLLMREGVHPETPPLPFTPGWDLVGMVDRLGGGISGLEPGQLVAALPITRCLCGVRLHAGA